MRWVVATTLGLSFGLLTLFTSTARAQLSVDAYLAGESPVAKTNLLANIGPDGAKAKDATAGIVIASPSSADPNYFFTWTRDSAIVFQALIDQYTRGQDASLRAYIDNYVAAQKIIQELSNPVGAQNSDGLGQPRFRIFENEATVLLAGFENWFKKAFAPSNSTMEVQRDGPALRATSLVTWANYLMTQNNQSYVSNTLWPLIQLDIDYVAANWNKTGLDLWSDTNSSSFFTTAVQHRALRQGAALATTLTKTDVAAGYTKQAADALCSLQSYWNSTAGYINANKGSSRSGKDASTVLASIHTFDAEAGCDAVTFQPCSDRALANLFTFINSFRDYSINSGTKPNEGVAVGRFPEDAYFGGNPWYFTTLAAAEQIYDSLIVWKKQGSITVTALSQPFFANVDPGIAVGTYVNSSSAFNGLIANVTNYADSFVAVVQKYTPTGGALAQQYSRTNGAPTGAADLSWSYVALLTAASARGGTAPTSWGVKSLTVPSTCQPSSGGGGGGTVTMSFNVQATTVFGENIYLVGSVKELANWSPDNALLLNADSYPTWHITVKLPASTDIEYKYIRRFNGPVTWEIDPNRHFTTPDSGSATLFDVWRS